MAKVQGRGAETPLSYIILRKLIITSTTGLCQAQSVTRPSRNQWEQDVLLRLENQGQREKENREQAARSTTTLTS